MQPFANAMEHLTAELQLLDLRLQRQVLRLRAAELFNEDRFRGLYISDAQVDALLHREATSPAEGATAGASIEDVAALTQRIDNLRAETNARVEAGISKGVLPPFLRLAEIFKLSSLELEMLLVAAAPDIDLRYETLYAYAQNDVTKKHATIDLALRMVSPLESERPLLRSLFAAEAPLLRYQLVRLVEDTQDRDPPLLGRFLKADERLVDFMIGLNRIDSRLLPFTRLVSPAARLGELSLPEDLFRQLASAARLVEKQGGLLCFHGAYGAGKRTAAEAICLDCGLPLLVADLAQVPVTPNVLGTVLPLLAREAMLQHAGLLLDHFEVLLREELQVRNHESLLKLAIPEAGLPVFVASENSWHPHGKLFERLFLSLEFPKPTFPLRLRIWQRALSENGYRLDGDADVATLASKFVLSGGQIEDAVCYANSLSALRQPGAPVISLGDLQSAARAQSNQGLRRLAQKVETKYRWDDIVLPPRATRQLRDVYTSAKYRHVVYSDWGFDRKLALGKGLNALFHGPSGTGKTMAASILASELGLDLYKIDLSSVVSKYIGETEKHLSRIFEEAQTSNAVLFFDEADALFGKRSEVKDAHDRYANIEIAYLLQKMEEYEGIVILATNLRNNMDDAFARRMHHVVEFPFPDAQYRERIWRGVMPLEAPLEGDVDFSFLARQFDMAGGNIRNVALTAAFMAAENSSSIRMEHLILATSREFQKMGKLPSKADFRDYYDLIREPA